MFAPDVEGLPEGVDGDLGGGPVAGQALDGGGGQRCAGGFDVAVTGRESGAVAAVSGARGCGGASDAIGSDDADGAGGGVGLGL